MKGKLAKMPGRERQSQASSPGRIALGFVMWLLLNGDGGNKSQTAGTEDGSSVWSFLLLPAGGFTLLEDPRKDGGCCWDSGDESSSLVRSPRPPESCWLNGIK